MLLVSPDAEQVVAEAVNAEVFEEPVSPSTALKSENPDSCGQSFEVSDDESVQKYGTVHCEHLTLSQMTNFTPFQTGRVCRRQF